MPFALTVALPRLDGKATEIYTFKDGTLAKTISPRNLNPVGPSRAPGDDIASLVLGKDPSDIVLIAAAANPLRRVMGDTAFEKARDIALGGVQSPAAQSGEFVVGTVCVPHMCGSDYTTWVFDHSGRVWASLVEDGKLTFYGDPSAAVRSLLNPGQE